MNFFLSFVHFLIFREMSFAKSPRQVRSGINTVPTPRRSISGSEEAEIRIPVSESPPVVVASESKKTSKKSDHNEPPLWICVCASVFSGINFTAVLMILHGWINVKAGTSPPMWFFGAIAVSQSLSPLIYASFLIGVVGTTIVGIWAFIKFPKMRAYTVWTGIFLCLMIFNFNLVLYLRLAVVEDIDNVNESKLKTAWYVFLVIGSLITGAAAAASPRTKVWRAPAFNSTAIKWTMKIFLAVGISAIGFAPLLSIATKKGQTGFYVGIFGVTVIKIVIATTLIMNHLARLRALKDDAERAPLVNQTTAT